MTHVFRKVSDAWFAPGPPARLAALRILIGLFALWYLIPRYGLYSSVASSPPELFAPAGLARMLPAPLPLGIFQALLLLLYGLNVVFLLGWRHAITGPAFGVLLLFVLCYRNSWSMIYHSDNLLVLHSLILGFTRAADAWSLDALIRSRRRCGVGIEERREDGVLASGTPPARHTATPPPHPSGFVFGRYGWPLRLICAVTVCTYFLAGVAKVTGPLGWSWAGGEALRSQMAADALRKELLGGEISPILCQLYDHLWLFTIVGLVTLLIELGAPVALLNRWVGRCWAAGALLMHWGILVMMGIQFEYSLSGIVFAAFLPLERPLTWVLSLRKRAQGCPSLPVPAPTCGQTVR